MHSPVFVKLCYSSFKARYYLHYVIEVADRTQESSDNKLEFIDEEPKIVGAMVQFLYNLTHGQDELTLVDSMKLSLFAHKWDMAFLCRFSMIKFDILLSRNAHEPCFQDAVRFAYDIPATTFSRNLRSNLVLQTVACYLISPEFCDFILRIPEFAKAVLSVINTHPEDLDHSRDPRFTCPDCGESFPAVMANISKKVKCENCGRHRPGQEWWQGHYIACTVCYDHMCCA